jgi:polysaccharide pyruvyl transferase WcaK-like protein
MTRGRAARLDLLLVAGTGIADDFWQKPFDMPHHIARWCTTARAAGTAVRFASIGAGPVTHPRSRRYFRDALASADYRSYRDHASHAFAQEIGVPAANDPVLPDLVFGMPIPAELAGRAVAWPPRRIALGVMGYTGWNVPPDVGEKIYADYLKKITWLAGQLLDKGCTVRLIVGNRRGDRRPVADLRAALAGHPAVAQGALVARDIATHEHVLEEIAASDLVIATRFHNVLKALLLGRPVISIGYARKNDDLMAEMGLDDYCHAVESFDPESVLTQLHEIAALPEPPMAQARDKVAGYRKQLDEQFDRLLAP